MSRTFRSLLLLAVILDRGKRLGQRCRIVLALLLLFVALPCRAFAADALITVSGTESLLPSGWDNGNITISFGDSAGHTYSQTVAYGLYSTSASIASAFGAGFSNTYYPSGLLCAHAEGAVIYFHLNGTASFNAPSLSNPSVSFSLSPSSGWTHLTLSISYITPNAASVGAAVTIIGRQFGSSQGSSTATFNGVPATVSNWSNTSISAAVPMGATSGKVVVTAGGLPSNGVAFTVLGISPPTVASLSPSSGNAGLAVYITGVGFGADEGTGTVTFNGTPAGVLNWSDSSITALVPSGATTGSVVVTPSGGQASNNNVVFTVSVSPCPQQ